MAITTGVSGTGQSPDGISEENMYTKADGPSNTEWYVAVTTTAGIFRFYTGDYVAALVPLNAGESQRVAIRSGEITRISFAGANTSVVTWYPTIIGIKG